VDIALEIDGLIRDQEEHRRRELEGRHQQLDEARRWRLLQERTPRQFNEVTRKRDGIFACTDSHAALQNIQNEPIVVNCTMNLEPFKSKVLDSRPETPIGTPMSPIADMTFEGKTLLARG